MKKVLLGTTALAALGLMPALAEAADKISLGLSGYYRFYGVIGDLDDGTDVNSPTGFEIGNGFREHGVGREGEIHFRGQTTLDNGIKVGVRVELEAETSGDQIDNSYIYFDGGFGRVEMGSMWGPGVIMSYGTGTGHVMPGLGNFASQVHVPQPGYLGGGAYFASYNWRIDGVNDKIVYYSPRFAGFQVGLAYTPDNKAAVGGVEESGAGINTDSSTPTTAGAGPSEVFTIGANYVNKFSNVDVALYGSYTDSDHEASGADDPKSWNLGAEFGYMGFKIGGSYLHIEHAGVLGTVQGAGAAPFGAVGPVAALGASATGVAILNDIDRDEYSVGASYSTGPWTFGLAYQNIEVDSGAADVDDNEADYFSIAGTYALGPGILLVGGLQYYDHDAGTGPGGAQTTADGTEYVLVLGTALSF
jgi:predicted porin